MVCCLYHAGDYPHGDVAELGGGHVDLPAAEMGNLEELSKVCWEGMSMRVSAQDGQHRFLLPVKLLLGPNVVLHVTARRCRGKCLVWCAVVWCGAESTLPRTAAACAMSSKDVFLSCHVLPYAADPRSRASHAAGACGAGAHGSRVPQKAAGLVQGEQRIWGPCRPGCLGSCSCSAVPVSAANMMRQLFCRQTAVIQGHPDGVLVCADTRVNALACALRDSRAWVVHVT
jgi:hypothetical protein